MIRTWRDFIIWVKYEKISFPCTLKITHVTSTRNWCTSILHKLSSHALNNNCKMNHVLSGGCGGLSVAWGNNTTGRRKGGRAQPLQSLPVVFLAQVLKRPHQSFSVWVWWDPRTLLRAPPRQSADLQASRTSRARWIAKPLSRSARSPRRTLLETPIFFAGSARCPDTPGFAPGWSCECRAGWHRPGIELAAVTHFARAGSS